MYNVRVVIHDRSRHVIFASVVLNVANDAEAIKVLNGTEVFESAIKNAADIFCRYL